jgi:hypothetical protein
LPLRSKRPKKEIRGFTWWFEYENNTRKIREGYRLRRIDVRGEGTQRSEAKRAKKGSEKECRIKIRACVILLNNNILYNNTSIKYKRLNEHKIKIVVWIKIIDQISIQIQNMTKYLKIKLTKNLIYKNRFKTYP